MNHIIMTWMEQCIWSPISSSSLTLSSMPPSLCTNKECICDTSNDFLFVVIMTSMALGAWIGWYMKSISNNVISKITNIHHNSSNSNSTATEIKLGRETRKDKYRQEWNDDTSHNSTVTTISSSCSLGEIDSFINYSKQTQTSLEVTKKKMEINKDDNIDDSSFDDDDGRYQVLHQSIILFMKHFFDYNNSDSISLTNRHVQIRNANQHNVVNYLSPKDMANLLFHKQNNATSLSLHEHNITSTPTTSYTITTTSTNNENQNPRISPNQMMNLFSQIQNYSVNTNHKLFFNQLFGTLDPIALAAEIVALGLHTSSYTWETAPVFTLMEREVFIRLGKLVFERDDHDSSNDSHDYHNNGSSSSSSESCQQMKDKTSNENDDIYNELVHNKYDGLMLPGGSLSNLTAIHVARHYCLYGTRTLKEHIIKSQSNYKHEDENGYIEEEKKEQSCTNDNYEGLLPHQPLSSQQPQLVAFVSSEAHYSFSKAASVTGIGIENLISVPTLSNGQMDVDRLDILLGNFHSNGCNVNRIPFFVAATAGSTVRGSFDDIKAIVNVCRKHEKIINKKLHGKSSYMSNLHTTSDDDENRRQCKIWVHVDGAWGGSAIFSSRPDMKQLLNGIQHVDSFTFNPHKLIGAPQQTTAFISRHKGILKAANSTGAKYLFDCRKNGAEFDLGDNSYTCGRKPDAIKLWALWKYYGCQQLGHMMESKADSLSLFARMIKNHDSFMLACTPWPFNVNFFYLPKRIRRMLNESGIDTGSENPTIPDEISKEIAIVSVKLKLKLHQSGVMLIPYQPLSNQRADCFRLVLAGNKVFEEKDCLDVLHLMDEYGSDL